MPTIQKAPKRKTESNPKPKKEAQKYYNTSQWKKLRSAYLMEHPLCEMCLKEGKTTPTQEIHHIKEILSGADDLERKDLAFNYSNLMALCEYHHHQIHNNKRKG